ncbi:unnamed protein product, partial [Ectocarpus fasciculatus]
AFGHLWRTKRTRCWSCRTCTAAAAAATAATAAAAATTRYPLLREQCDGGSPKLDDIRPLKASRRLGAPEVRDFSSRSGNDLHCRGPVRCLDRAAVRRRGNRCPIGDRSSAIARR